MAEQSPPPKSPSDRDAKLAQALRANLRRRKTPGRTPAAPPQNPPPDKTD